MKTTRRVITVLMAVIILAGGTYAMHPVTVSPGSDGGVAVIGQNCPTFSWSEVSEAVAYEVGVFEAQTIDVPSYDDMVIMAEPVLSIRIPAPALSWTPSTDDCLMSENVYVWYVRGTDVDGNGAWSGGSIFEVDVTAGFERFEEEIVRAVEDYLVKEEGISGYSGTGIDVTTDNGDSEVIQTEKSTVGLLNIPHARLQGTEGPLNAVYGDGAGAINTGSFNTFIGINAGYYNNGSNNTMIGHSAGRNNGIGSGNVFLGRFAGYNEAGSNKLYIDNSSTSAPLIYGEFDNDSVSINGDLNISGILYSISDARVKDNIMPIESSLDMIASIKGVSYHWKDEEFEGRKVSGRRHFGVVAQEIEKILPELVEEGSDGKKRVAYVELIPVLIEAVKEQQMAIENQQEEIDELKNQLHSILSSHMLTKNLQ
jgi:hypothetical protein